MASIKTTIHAPLQLTVRTVVGKVTADELVEALRSYYTGPVTNLILWDFEKAELEDITTDQIHRLVRVTKELLKPHEGGKRALAGSSDLAYGLGRMFDSEQQVASPKLEHKAFRTKDQALEWLFDGKKPVIE